MPSCPPGVTPNCSASIGPADLLVSAYLRFLLSKVVVDQTIVIYAVELLLLGLKSLCNSISCCRLVSKRAEDMSLFSTMQTLNASPMMSYSPHAKAASRHSLKGQNNRTQYQVCGPSICRASAAVSEERLTNGKVSPMSFPAPQQPCEAGRLTDDGTAFLEEHRIRGYEVGPDQQTTIVTIANLLQVC